eukprot:UN13580
MTDTQLYILYPYAATVCGICLWCHFKAKHTGPGGYSHKWNIWNGDPRTRPPIPDYAKPSDFEREHYIFRNTEQIKVT